MTRRLDILVHELDPYDTRDYTVRHFIPLWEERGISCHVRRGPREPRRAEAVLLHVDLTVVPQDYAAAAREYAVGINVEVIDISKRRISDRIVTEDGGYDGPVIVKTDLNSGGGPEALHEIRRREREQARSADSRGEPAPAVVIPFGPHDYPVLSSGRRIAPEVWRDPRVIVEKFRPEMRGGLYCLRKWIFLGDQEVNYISFSKHPIVKEYRIAGWEPLDQVPADLRERRRALRFDYGKFDYALVEGEAILYDANRTPVGRRDRTVAAAIPRLAEGIAAFLPQ